MTSIVYRTIDLNGCGGSLGVNDNMIDCLCTTCQDSLEELFLHVSVQSMYLILFHKKMDLVFGCPAACRAVGG